MAGLVCARGRRREVTGGAAEQSGGAVCGRRFLEAFVGNHSTIYIYIDADTTASR